MEEPKVQVGILFAPRIEFVLLSTYHINGAEVSGKQVVTYDEGKVLWNGYRYDELLFEPQHESADAFQSADASGTDAFELLDVTIGINFHWERKENQRFQGALKIIVEEDKLTGINVINVEDYLTSVISSEMSATASLELLKAHAVISRSWLLASLSSSPSPVGRGEDSPCYKTADRSNYAVLKENQERLKKEPTEAEKIVWERLRNHQLGTKFRRQHIIDNYIADFVSLEKKLIIEVDGEYHGTPKQKDKDKERTLHLESLGYHLLRFTNNEIIAQPDRVIERVKACIAQPPLPTGEGPGERLCWYDREDHTRFDVCADDHCQRYQGITRASTEIVKQAIAATRGEVLTYESKICDARFSKCCGGAFEEFQYCWEDVKYPYLTYSVDREANSQLSSINNQLLPDLTQEAEAERWIRTSPEAFCNTTDKKILSQVLNNYDQETTDFYRWKVEYTQDELSALILKRSGIDYGQIIDLIPIARGTSGRLWKLKIVGSEKTLTIGKELEIRRTLSPSHLYSSAFVVDKEEISPEGIPGRFILTGAGWGHGVGLCQIGAAVMGEKGYKYDAILLHYYTGASIDKLYE
nr:SpoIID/LytB domain-containing protein [uncultured Bacteroides sp.]